MRLDAVLAARLLAACLVAFVLYDCFRTDVQSETFSSVVAFRRLEGARSSHSKAATSPEDGALHEKASSSRQSSSNEVDTTGKKETRSLKENAKKEKKKTIIEIPVDTDDDDEDNMPSKASSSKEVANKEETKTLAENPVDADDDDDDDDENKKSSEASSSKKNAKKETKKTAAEISVDADDDDESAKSSKTSSSEEVANKEENNTVETPVDADDDDDDESKKSSETSDKHHTTTEKPIYDEKGWHVSEDDFVTRVMHPERLQPFYLMPMFFAVKLMVTFMVFGFSLRFKEANPNCFFDTLGKLMKYVSGGAFILVALYGYKTDFGRLQKHTIDCDSFGKKLGVFLIVWVTSANYVACRAMWNSLLIENPVSLLGLMPKYSACPIVPIPLCPGGAEWLNPMKHIYALVLLPYYIPFYAVTLCQGCVLSGWLCCTKCAVFFGMCCGSINCACALVGTVITFGLWAWAKDALGYWWGLESPIFFMVAIQAWASYIAPLLFSALFGCFLCSSADSLVKGVMMSLPTSAPEGASAEESPADALFANSSRLEADDIEVLVQYNKELLEKDFEPYRKVPTEDSNPATTRAELEDAKIHIFGKTLFRMSSICFEQLLLIFLVRALTTHADYSHYVGAMKRTLTERTWAAYFHHIHTLAERSTEEAINSINFLL